MRLFLVWVSRWRLQQPIGHMPNNKTWEPKCPKAFAGVDSLIYNFIPTESRLRKRGIDFGKFRFAILQAAPERLDCSRSYLWCILHARNTAGHLRNYWSRNVQNRVSHLFLDTL